MDNSGKLSPTSFYNEWKGHTIPDLTNFHKRTINLRDQRPIVYLAGDSSLDNKAWVPTLGPGGATTTVPVPEIYDHVLKRPECEPDVAFWMNHLLGDKATVINTAIEESLLRQRSTTLLPQDEFIRDHIRPQDILVVSVGANDIALLPAPATAFHMLRLSWLSSKKSLENGTASGLAHFRDLFGTQVQEYLSKLTSKTKPAAILVCMIYYPLEAHLSIGKGWADMPLKLLGYGRDPTRLQAAIRAIYDQATSKIVIEGSNVIPVPLFEVMDGKNADDYVVRVEPSVEGGKKMGEKLADIISSLGSARESKSPPPLE